MAPCQLHWDTGGGWEPSCVFSKSPTWNPGGPSLKIRATGSSSLWSSLKAIQLPPLPSLLWRPPNWRGNRPWKGGLVFLVQCFWLTLGLAFSQFLPVSFDVQRPMQYRLAMERMTLQVRWPWVPALLRNSAWSMAGLFSPSVLHL